MTDEEERRVIAIATGQIPPSSGMEIHFLKVLAGQAIACSIEERKWLLIVDNAKEQQAQNRLNQQLNAQARHIEKLQDELKKYKTELAAYRFHYGDFEDQPGANNQEIWREMEVESLRKWREIRLSLNLPIPKEIEEQELYKPEWLRGISGSGSLRKAGWVPATRSGVPTSD